MISDEDLFPNFQGRAFNPINFRTILDPERPETPPSVYEMGGYTYAKAGEIVRVSGDGSVGKSMFLLELTAKGRAGGLLLNADRVMWIDEEGDEDILCERLRAIGIDTDEIQERFHYLLNEGIALDLEPDRQAVFDAIEDFKPDAIVIDSHVRMYTTLNENDNGDMAMLFNLAIKPMSRKFGATVFIIDHTNKSTGRTRGAGDKRNQADRVWLFDKVTDDSFDLKHDKSRRNAAPPTKRIRRVIENHRLTHE